MIISYKAKHNLQIADRISLFTLWIKYTKRTHSVFYLVLVCIAILSLSISLSFALIIVYRFEDQWTLSDY